MQLPTGPLHAVGSAADGDGVPLHLVPAAFAPAMHIWTASKLDWVTIPDAMPQFERGPQE